MNQIAPPGAVISVSDNAPHTMTYCFNSGYGLTPAGVAAVSTSVTTYLSAAKKVLIGREQARNGGTGVVPDPVLGTSSGTYPVLNADVVAQVAALAAVIATVGNAS